MNIAALAKACENTCSGNRAVFASNPTVINVAAIQATGVGRTAPARAR